MNNELEFILESILTESLTKGSQRVMANKAMVSDLADAVRDDARAHPHNFPAGSAKNFQKAKDEDVATWFLEQIDKIEKEGYEGTIYSKDGVYNEWIVRRYIAGSHNWEDIIGVMNMNLRDWTLLKNRGMLQAGHTDVPKFNSVRDIGKYMSTHYHDKLNDIRDSAAQAAIKKQAKTAKIVDNEDYKIYTVFNWAGARTVGLGTQWCTANSKSDFNYQNYSGRGMLFQMFPKNPEQVDKIGRVTQKKTVGPEKYQFDAGSFSFKDIADDDADREYIKNKFPYLYTDLIKGLKQNKAQIESAMDELEKDPSLNTPEGRIKKYNIDDEIKKLEKFKNTGFFTDKVRPQNASKPESSDEVPQLPNQGQQMENIDKDVAAMLESLKKYDILKESVAPVLEKKSKPDFLDVDKDGNKEEPMKKALKDKEEDKKEVNEGADQEVLAWMKRFEKLGRI